MKDKKEDWEDARGLIDQQLELVNLMAEKTVDESTLKKVTRIQCPELEAKKTEESPAYTEYQEELKWDGPGCIDLNKPKKHTGPPKKDKNWWHQASRKDKDFEIKTEDQEVYNFKNITPDQHKTVVDTLKKLHGRKDDYAFGLDYEKEAAVPEPMSMKKIYQILDEESEEFYQTILDNLHEHYPKLKFEWGEYGELLVSWESRILSVDNAKTYIDKHTLKSIREKIELITQDQNVVRLGLETIIKAELDKIF